MDAIIEFVRRISPNHESLELSVRELTKRLEKGQRVFTIDKDLNIPWVTATILSNTSLDKQQKLLFDVSRPHGEPYRVNGYCVALMNSAIGALKLTKRVIAGKDVDNLKSGIIADTPNKSNKHRFLVLMDDGSAMYASQDNIYPIIVQSTEPWYDSRFLPSERDNNHDANVRRNQIYCDQIKVFYHEFRRKYMISAEVGDKRDIYKDGLLLRAKVINVDCDVVTIRYVRGETETVYRGSLRFMQPDYLIKDRQSRITSTKELNPTLQEYLHLYNMISNEHFGRAILTRPTAKKSCSSSVDQPTEALKQYQLISYVPKSLSEDFDRALEIPIEDHECSNQCLQDVSDPESRYDNLVDSFRDESDLMMPLRLGWIRGVAERDGVKSLVYSAPCGKIFFDSASLIDYLGITRSRLDIDYFCFDKKVHLVRGETMMKFVYLEPNIAMDKETGQNLERKNIQVLNMFSDEHIPGDFKYSTSLVMHKSLLQKGFSISEEAKSGCDCEDGCLSGKCHCRMLTINEFTSQPARKWDLEPRPESELGYINKRHYRGIETGLYECNEFCKCSSNCLNRVVQNGIRSRFVIRKTLDKGWGVFALDDIPKGAFLCTYTGVLYDNYDDNASDIDDTYLLDLDIVSKNENTRLMEHDNDQSLYEEVSTFSTPNNEVPTFDSDVSFEKDADLKVSANSDVSSLAVDQLDEAQDQSFEVDSPDNVYFSSSDQSQRNRDNSGPELSEDELKWLERRQDSLRQPCPELSDDELAWLRQSQAIPDHGDAQASAANPSSDSTAMDQDEEVMVYNDGQASSQNKKKCVSIHEILGSRDATIDSKHYGNVSRFMNHSCNPNAFAQTVFINTHDPRFPTVAFFASRHIKAHDEVTWDYQYVVGSIPDKVLECRCGSKDCRGRLL